MQHPNQQYTEEQQATFCEQAQEFGIGRTMRELGYPKSYATGIQWMKARGIKPNINKAMQQAKLWHTFYEVEDLLEQIDTGLGVIQEMMVTATTADDMKKLAEAMQKLVNTRQVLEGKATTISEKRETTQAEAELQAILREERARQANEAGTGPRSQSEALSEQVGTEMPEES